MKIDIKTILIIGLSIVLIFVLIFRRTIEKNDKNKLEDLKRENIELSLKNNELENENKKINNRVVEYKERVNEINTRLDNSQIIIDKLKKKKSENYNYVNPLSGNGVANAFTNYLEERR